MLPTALITARKINGEAEHAVGDLAWMPDRETEAVVEQEVAPCS